MYMEIDQRIYLELCYIHLKTMSSIIYLSASFIFSLSARYFVINDIPV